VSGERVRGALALGSEAFVDALRRCVRGNRLEQPMVRSWQRLLPFERVMELVAREKNENWARNREAWRRPLLVMGFGGSR
jgi:hypothetical protein